MTDADVLQQLDWHTVRCQCEQESCRGKCRNNAEYTIEFHGLDHCNKADDPDLNAFGNYTFLLCHDCLQALATTVAHYLAQLNRFGRYTCQTCGAPAATVRPDVIREVQRL